MTEEPADPVERLVAAAEIGHQQIPDSGRYADPMPEDSTARATPREVARAAFRAELIKAAVALVLRDGYDNVTLTDLAAAAGVSKSTFLRYLGSKEGAIVDALIVGGKEVAEYLAARPESETAWEAVAAALVSAMQGYETEPANALQLARIVSGNPALRAATLERQAGWHAELADTLMQRANPPRSQLAAEAIAAAAVSSFAVALRHWMKSEATAPMHEFFEEALGAVTSHAP